MPPYLAIQKVAVIGSGVMGAQIAAHFANAGINVALFDVVLPDQQDRHYLPKKAIEDLLVNPLKPLMSSSKIKLIHPYNLEDDLDALKEVDWVVEAIIEKFEIKDKLYLKLIEYLKPNCIISSNTSTIPLNELTKNLPSERKQYFLITHFFNPVRYLQLLEIVTHNQQSPEIFKLLSQFCEDRLGKILITCKDTPGFIANRLGCFWLELGIRKAIKYNILPHIADYILSQYFGIPKTGIFKLWDLIGVDLMPLISNSIIENLGPNDRYKIIINNQPLDLISKMIEQKMLGNKTKQGFFKKEKGENKTQEYVLNLTSLEYEPLSSINVPKFANLKELINYPGNIGAFAWELMSETLAYASQLYPEAAYSIYDIDLAMKTGYGWKYGPFELIDQFSNDDVSGAELLKIKLQLNNHFIPDIINNIGHNKFFNKEGFWHDGHYQTFNDPLLNPFKAFKKSSPLTSNSSAAIWDLGDQIIGLEFTKKLHVLDYNCFEMMEQAINYAESKYKGLIIFSDDNNFCAGADLKNLLVFIEAQEFDTIRKLIDFGQKTHLKLKYSKKPVIAAVNGVALGGGCEILLHSHKVIAHAEAKIGLVESNIGLIPGWGGCKEIVLRSFYNPTSIDSFNSLYQGFQIIINGQQSHSAFEAIELGLLDKDTHIIMNNKNLLAVSKEIIKETMINQQTPIKLDTIYLDQTKVSDLRARLKTHETGEKSHLASYLSNIFLANNQNVIKETKLLELEQECFISLCKKEKTKNLISKIINGN